MNSNCEKYGGSMTKGFVMELPTGRQAITTWVEGEIDPESFRDGQE